jgi:hypothetical protein
MGYLIKQQTQQFVSYESIIESRDLQTMGSLPVSLKCYDNSQSAITNKIFVPLSCTLRQIKATIGYDFLPNDHIVIGCNPGTYFFFKDNVLRATNAYVNTSLYYQRTHSVGGIPIITNFEPDKLTGNITITTSTGNDATVGDADLLVSIAGYLMNV